MKLAQIAIGWYTSWWLRRFHPAPRSGPSSLSRVQLRSVVVSESPPVVRNMPVERAAEMVSAATYGTVLVLAALSVIGVVEVAAGYSAELVFGVGVATWLAHVFAQLVGIHVHLQRPLERKEIAVEAIDATPILASTILPGCALLLGSLDVLSDSTARTVAIAVAMAQLLVIGVIVGRIAPSGRGRIWVFGVATVATALVVVAVTRWLGH